MAADPLMRAPDSTVFTAKTAAVVCEKLAQFIARRIAEKGGPFRLALSGGRTPQLLYQILAGLPIAWTRVEFFWGDERFVPHDDPDSNYRMADENLLSRISVPSTQIYPIPTDTALETAAAQYEDLLKQVYGEGVLRPGRPLFDLNLLGIGQDGHTASLLPGQPVLKERKKWVAAVPHGRSEPRITLTYPALQSSAVTVFLAAGEDKANAVRQARAGNGDMPAGRLRPEGSVFWFFDDAAARG
jgi:6-phosphogluconolactonase